MPDIRIHRTHALGLKKAREVAWQWAEEVEKKFGMDCTVLEGETSDTVEFTRVNLMDPADLVNYHEFDVIFCRNLLIYFDDLSRRQAAAVFAWRLAADVPASTARARPRRARRAPPRRR